MKKIHFIQFFVLTATTVYMTYSFSTIYNFLTFLRQGCGGMGGARVTFFPSDISFLVDGHTFAVGRGMLYHI